MAPIRSVLYEDVARLVQDGMTRVEVSERFGITVKVVSKICMDAGVRKKLTWTDDLNRQLRAMWAEGKTTDAIGKALGLSKNAIIGQAHRLNLDGRDSPIRPAVKGEIIDRIRLALQNKERNKWTNKDIANRFGVSMFTVSKVAGGRVGKSHEIALPPLNDAMASFGEAAAVGEAKHRMKTMMVAKQRKPSTLPPLVSEKTAEVKARLDDSKLDMDGLAADLTLRVATHVPASAPLPTSPAPSQASPPQPAAPPKKYQRFKQCQWIDGEPKNRFWTEKALDAAMCRDAAVDGPYCLKHRNLTYQPVNPRAEIKLMKRYAA